MGLFRGLKTQIKTEVEDQDLNQCELILISDKLHWISGNDFIDSQTI